MALVRGHKQGWAIALTVVGLLALGFVPSFPSLPYFVDQGLQRVILAALALAFVAFLGGGRSLAPRSAGLGAALRLGAYPVLLSLGLCLVELTGVLELVAAEGAAAVISRDWLVDALGVLLLCGGVGVFEEGLFRALLLGGMLSRHGGTRNAVVTCAIVSSVVFGAAHVTGDAGLPGAVVLAQMLLKTVQTASLSLLLTGVYLRTHSFWGVAALHALADFFVLLPTALVAGASQELGSYVTQGVDFAALMEGVALVAVYVVAVALYAPCAVRGLALVEQTPVPERGPLEPGWEPRASADVASGLGGDAPVPPDGL